MPKVKEPARFPLTRGLSWLLIDLPRAIHEILVSLTHIKESLMALNAEVAAFAARMDEATNNIAADIRTILDNPATALSDEDRATLEASVGKLEALASER